MVIKRLIAILIMGGWGITLASPPMFATRSFFDAESFESDEDNDSFACTNIIKPLPGGAGYEIIYADGTPPSIFPANTTITITVPGSYILCGDVSGNYTLTTPAIRIFTSSVELDLAGFSVNQTNNNSNGVGIDVAGGFSYVTVSNGRITNFSTGLDNGASHVVARNIQADDSGIGFYIRPTAIDYFIGECSGNGGSGYGFYVDSGARSVLLRKCAAIKNVVEGFYLNGTSNIIVQNCRAVGNTGSGFYNNTGAVLTGNFAYNNAGGNYSGPGPVGSIVIDNGAQLPPGIRISPIDNIEIV